MALELFALQFKHNSAYRRICEVRKLTPQVIGHWTQIPVVPTAAFKEMELTSLAPDERTAVFHSSGTTEQKPSRHFHSVESLAVYEASLWAWFAANVATGTPSTASASCQSNVALAETVLGVPAARQFQLLLLTPPPAQVPHSSLVHMFETVQQNLGGAIASGAATVPASQAGFFGKLAPDGTWTLNFAAIVDALSPGRQTPDPRPLLLLGTAFSFVHLLDHLAEHHFQFELPKGSRVMETGGYKNRSRTMPKAELHALITKHLGVAPDNIICEYGMSELSSQAYDGVRPSPGAAILNIQATSDLRESPVISPLQRPGRAHSGSSIFHFPPWARVQIVSPEHGREVAEGETGLIRIFDLANVFSVAAIQTEDLGIRRGDGFELIGRAQLAEPRGCSLMTP